MLSNMKAPLLALGLLASSASVSALPQTGSASSSYASDNNNSSSTAATGSSASLAVSVSSALSSAGVVTPSVLTTKAPSLISTSVPATPAPVSTTIAGGAGAHSFRGPAWLKNSGSLEAALSQDVTNGQSKWGTFKLPGLNKFLNTPGTPIQNGSPWGNRNANNTNYYSTQSIPDTGMTRTYDFTVASATIAPDGVSKPAILVNGAFPGPLIEANWGDWIMVNVHNELPNEGTTLHWHGFLQQGTGYYDGVPAVQQCPIAPGKSFQYVFQASLYGTSWYHSHYSAQYAGGALGPIVVHGPPSLSYDVDVGPIMLSDWYHDDYYSLVQQVEAPASAGAPPPASNNTLINGKANYPCDATTKACTPNAGISKFNFTSGKKHRLRLINTSAEATMKFTIDAHNFTVFANDYVQINPYVTDVITLGVGQRSDVIVEATGSPTDAYWMRANISTSCSSTDGISPFAVAAIYYEQANSTAVPNSVMTVTDDQINLCANDDLSLTTPVMSLTPDPNPPVTQSFDIEYVNNATNTTEGFNVWTVNGQTFHADYNDPLLLEAKIGNFDFEPQWNVYNFGTNSSIRMIWYNYFQFGPHPMHLHGHNVFVLAEGFGTWDGTVTNPGNPQRRDVQLVQAAQSATVPAYIVVEIQADNPGVWPFHCHIAWHVSGGLYANIMEHPNELPESNIPMVMAQTCRDWSAWTNTNIPDQIDSGL